MKKSKGHTIHQGSKVEQETTAPATEISENPLYQLNCPTPKILSKKEHEVIATEKRFRSLLENGSELITLLDEQYIPFYRSPAALRLTGWTLEERQQVPVMDLVHPDDRTELAEAFGRAVGNPGKPCHALFRTLHKTGHYIWLEGTMTDLLKDESIQAIVINLHDVTESKVSETLLKESYEELRLLAGRLQDIREEERTNMAREIHDELGQQLTGLKMDLSWLRRRPDLNDNISREKIKGILALVDGTVNTVRRLASELRPSILDDLGLEEALEWHSMQFKERSGIQTYFIQFGEKQRLPSSVVTGLFRIYQEALTNVARHARAGRVTAVLDSSREEVALTISDDGKGFDVKGIESKKTLGLLGMKERALMMGARYEFISQPGQGTMIQVSVPLESPHP